MILLQATETLRAKAGTGSAITCTVQGDEVTAGADSFKVLDQRQLGTGVGTLYTVPASTQALIKQIHLANTTGSPVTGITFYINGTAAVNQITAGFTIPANGYAVFANGEWKIYNQVGALITTVSVVASEVPSTPAGTLSSTNVQDALNELDGDVQTVSSGLSAHLADGTDAHMASAIGNTPAGNIAATNVQTALNELDGEKVAGPASVTDDLPAVFDGTTGKLIKQKTYAAFKTLLALVKGDVGLGNVDNTSDANKPVSTAQQTALNLKEDLANKATDFSVLNNTKYPTTSAVDAQISARVVGLWDDRGNYDASVNTFPATGGSGTAGAILKGDIWTISVAGTLGGVAVNIGDTVRAVVDTPGQTAGNWAVHEANLGYTPENNANKSTDVTMAANSATLYPSQSAAKGYSDSKVVDSIADSDTARAPSRNAVFDALALKQNQDADLDAIAALTPTNDDIIQRKAGAWTNRTMAQFILDLPVVSTIAQGVMSVANLLRLTSQHRNLMSDVPGGVNVKADGIYRLDATMASGSSLINSAGATFVAGDVGKIVGMNGVGAGAQTVYGTITARNSATQITVDFQATTTVAANGVLIYGTDDLTALNAAIASGGRWEMPDWNEINDLATRMLLSNAPSQINQTGTQIRMSGGIANYDVGFNERGNFVHILRSTNPNATSLTLGRTQLTGVPFDVVPTTGASNQALKGIRVEGFTVECAGNVPMGLRGRSSHKGIFLDIHIKNPAYRAYDFSTVGGQLGEATDYSKNLHERLSARCLDGSSSSTTAAGAVANLFANANLVLTSSAAFQATGGAGIAMTTINGAIRPTYFTYTGISGNTLTGITCLFTIAGQSAALANLALVAPAGPYYADGIVGDGDPNSQNASAGNAPGNASLNVFLDCGIVHAGGMARRYLNADSNKFINFAVNRAAGGTGIGCGYFGSSSAINTARNNMDLGGDPGAGGAVIYGQEMTGITANPLANRWYDYELGNGAPRPVNGVGASITTSDFIVTYNGGITPALSNRGQGGLTGNAATIGGAAAAGALGVLPNMFVIFPPQGPAVGTSGEFLVGLSKTAAGTGFQLGMNYGVANTVADASTGVGVNWVGTAVADELWVLVPWCFTVIGGSALIVARTIPLRRSVDAALTGWVTTVAAYKAIHVWTSVAFNSALANPGPAYLSLQARTNTAGVVSVLPGSVAKVNTA